MFDVIKIGKYESLVSRQGMPLKPEHIKDIQEVLARWQEAFPREPTWVQNNFGVPSLFVRADCVVNDDKVCFFEIEERPGGMGLMSQFVPGLVERLAALRQEWPQFGFVSSPSRGETEDRLWLEPGDGSNGLVVVRAEPEEAGFHQYQSRSVSSVLLKGDKSYGVKLGWWWLVTEEDALPFETGFVLKPTTGSKCRGLCFYAPLRRLAKHEGRMGVDKLLKKSNSTIAQIEATLALSGKMYCQPYIPPMESEIPGYELMIYRLMFGYSPIRKIWEYIAGTWNARNNLRIHGASDTLFGPVIVEV
jgi:hypothetical protein